MDLELVLQADVFDGPARRDWVLRTLGPDGQPDPRNLLMLAILAGEVVGFASGTVIDHPDKPPTLFINEVGVNDSAQRQGIGRALLQAIRTAGRARGCQASWVTTEAENSAARALYRAEGGAETVDIVMYDWNEASLAR
ncbi:MAG: GNAT family N-acetyltransferase [Rhodobacteraceae bacterium]|nr:GNAT family N-acetyltransferase [Paracoccaceae bacterium]